MVDVLLERFFEAIHRVAAVATRRSSHHRQMVDRVRDGSDSADQVHCSDSADFSRRLGEERVAHGRH